MALTLKPIVPTIIHFRIIGTSPLIQHAWSEKGYRQLRMTAAERKKQPKVARDPEGETSDAMYKLEDGSPAFPALAFKAALVAAAHKDLGIEKTLVRKSFFLPASEYEPGLLCPLEFESLAGREDIVRIGAGQTDLRYRPEFTGWATEITAEIDSDLLNEQDVINLVNRAGFSVGIGEWRPEKGGEYGRFKFDEAFALQSSGPTKA